MVLVLSSAAASLHAEPIRIASKNFGESYLLSEIVAQLLEARGFEIRRQFGLGGTLICYSALVSNEIDLYIEYTGTLAQAVLKSSERLSIDALNEKLTEIEMLQPFGFNNTYVMAMRAEHAQRLGIRAIGDLRDHPDLKIFVGHEFLQRLDGWPGLSARYGLTTRPQGIEHALAYQAMEDGSVDVTDAYSTDGELLRYNLRSLNDELGFFPEYLAAPLVRRDLDPRVRAVLAELAGTLSADQMSSLNNAVAASDFASVAQGFLSERGLVVGRAAAKSHFWQDLSRNTLRHLELTLIALFASIVAGVGLGIAIYQDPRLARFVIYVCGLLQTIPSIALLALMIPLFGIGKVPAIIALFLYALLPILRNTVVALTTIDPELVRTATAIGLSSRERLRHLLIPMALPSIFAGIRTAAVISVGTATLAAFIGAGGLGDPIVTGLALNDTNLILQGAIPAACLAIVIELLFERLERVLIPAPLRAS